jgi:GntR family histidine utilization transcriptional repressor
MGVPGYLRIKQEICRQIDSGAWPPHHRVPSENDFVGQFGLSRMTVNRALRELTADGRLYRRQGLGTFVADPKSRSPLLAVNNIASAIEASGHRHRAEVKRLLTEPASASLADSMGIEVGSPVFRSIIVHHEDNVPAQIEDRYVNPLVAPHYLEQDFLRLTPNAYLQSVSPLTSGEHLVEAVQASPDEARWLKISRSQPCLLIQRRTWTGQQIVTIARLLYPGNRHRLEGRFGPSL